MKWAKGFLIVLAGLAIYIAGMTKWIREVFGHVTLAQIYLTITQPLTGTDPKIIGSGILVFVLLTIVIIAFALIVFYSSRICAFLGKRISAFNRLNTWFNQNRQRPRIAIAGCIIFALIICFFVYKKTNSNFQVVSFFYEINGNPYTTDKNKEDWIANHMYIPQSKEIIFKSKKNVVLVFAESLESTFEHINQQENYLPYLSRLRTQQQTIDTMEVIKGTECTIAAAVSWHLGLPFKVPFFAENAQKYRPHLRGFLPGARSVFDVLQEKGYTIVLVMGSNAHFSGMDLLFKNHGNTQIMDSRYWEKQGYNPDEHKGSGWGYSDAFVLARAREQFKQLQAGNKPFVLFIETIDTHTPDGWCPEEKRYYNDIRDAFVELDYQLNHFMNDLLQSKQKPTAIALVGDHILGGKHAFIPKAQPRSIYNVFLGDVPSIPTTKRNSRISAIDMAPSILHMAGAHWKNNQYGLGTSIFSPSPSLLDRFDKHFLNDKLAQPSNYYQSLY